MTVSLVRIYKSQMFIKATGRSYLIFNLYYIYDHYFYIAFLNDWTGLHTKTDFLQLWGFREISKI